MTHSEMFLLLSKEYILSFLFFFWFIEEFMPEDAFWCLILSKWVKFFMWT